jgi:hypothetical protein
MPDELVTSYVELGLRLGRHVEGLVDAYFGPPELKRRIDTEELQEPDALAADVGRLRIAVDDDGFDESRRRWLRAQLIGLETVAQRLAGEEIGYEDEVERCYGVRPQRVPEREFEAAHRELAEVLPGAGSLAERYQAWREDSGIAGEALSGIVDSLAAELHSRTKALFGLPEGEGVEFEYVNDEPWAAFNYYLGNLSSRIAVNVDLAMTPDFVAELVPHEAYPGHHTEHAWKEQLLIRDRGQEEETIVLIGTPQNLISEGIAGLGAEILLGEDVERVTAEHVAATGIDYDPDVSREVKRARRPLTRVQSNVALMLHSDGATLDEGRDYLMRWGLASAERAAHQLEFVLDPTWRAYISTYAEGYRLCRDFVGGEPERFKRLLTQQLTPDDLR